MLLKKTPLKTQTLIVSCCTVSQRAHLKHPRMLQNAHPRFALPSPPSWNAQGGFLGMGGVCVWIFHPRPGWKNPSLTLGSPIKREGNTNSALLGISGRHSKGILQLGKRFPKDLQSWRVLYRLDCTEGEKRLVKMGTSSSPAHQLMWETPGMPLGRRQQNAEAADICKHIKLEKCWFSVKALLHVNRDSGRIH